MHRILLTTAAALVASCAAVPPMRLETEHGVVRAGTRAQAEPIAAALARTPQVRAVLEAVRWQTPELWVVEHDLDGALGICYERRIELTPQAGEYVVVHELVHWYIPGSPFDGLPHFVEEGLCDFVTLEILGITWARVRENEAIGELTVPLASLDMDIDDWLRLPASTREDLTRLGFTVVSRLGLPRLRELAAAGTEPLDYIQEAAIPSRTPPSIEARGCPRVRVR